MNALGILLTTALIAVIFTARRDVALLAAMAGVLYLTEAEAIYLGGFNVYAYRFIEVAAFLRVIFRSELPRGGLLRMDRAMIAVYVFTAVVFVLRSREGIGYAIGVSVDALMSYFAFRGLIQTTEDFRSFLGKFVFLLIPYALLVFYESRTQHNLLASAEEMDTLNWLRNGRLRCQGSFRHPSLMGTLGATMFPLYIAYGLSIGNRLRAAAGIAACLVIVWAANSGGPVGCLAASVVGWLMWFIRTRMRLVRIGFIVVIVGLMCTMKAPIWYVLTHVGSVTGGDAWHRAYLLDIASQNFGKWWLAGMPISETANWFPYMIRSTGGADITNMFISFGLSAGVGAVILLVRLVAVSFKTVGEAMSVVPDNDDDRYLVWGLGAMLAGHIFNWLGITYYDQSFALLVMQLAAIAGICRAVTLRTVQQDEEEEVIDIELEPAGLNTRSEGAGSPTEGYA